MARKMRPLIDRLLAKVTKLSSGCWFWCGTKNGAGYGTIGLGTKEQGKGFVHRVSYELHKGTIPDEMVVCHKCDCKLCVNPDHLFLGTHQDNIDDAKSKGRMCAGERWKNVDRNTAIGERHGMAKLTESDAKEILRLFHSGQNKAQIARRFGVSRASIRNIVLGRNWKHLNVV